MRCCGLEEMAKLWTEILPITPVWPRILGVTMGGMPEPTWHSRGSKCRLGQASSVLHAAILCGLGLHPVLIVS